MVLKIKIRPIIRLYQFFHNRDLLHYVLHSSPLLAHEYFAQLLFGQCFHCIRLVAIFRVENEFNLSEAALSNFLHNYVLIDFLAPVALLRRRDDALGDD
jgi:hypothetical protein